MAQRKIFGEHLDARRDTLEARQVTLQDEVREQAVDIREMHYQNTEHFKTIADRLDRVE